MTPRERKRSACSILAALSFIASPACLHELGEEQADDAGVVGTAQPLTAAGPTRIPLDQLPRLDSLKSTEVFIQQLTRPTELGENAVIHVKLQSRSL